MAYGIARSLVALLVAYLLAGFLFVILYDPGDAEASLYDRVIVDGWKEISCHLSGRSWRACCGWTPVSWCPISRSITVAVFAFALSIIPVIAIMSAVRWFCWRRPLSEIVTGGGLGLLAAVLVTQIPVSGPAELGGDRYPELELLPFVLPAMIGGYAYWIVAGRPRPSAS